MAIIPMVKVFHILQSIINLVASALFFGNTFWSSTYVQLFGRGMFRLEKNTWLDDFSSMLWLCDGVRWL